MVVRPADLNAYRKLFGDGDDWGIAIEYVCQVDAVGIAHALILADTFIGDDACVLVLGDNLFHGGQLATQLRDALSKQSGRPSLLVRLGTLPAMVSSNLMRTELLYLWLKSRTYRGRMMPSRALLLRWHGDR